MSVSVMCVCMYVCVPVNKQLESKEFKLAVKCGTPPAFLTIYFKTWESLHRTNIYCCQAGVDVKTTNAKLTAPDIWGLSDFE